MTSEKLRELTSNAAENRGLHRVTEEELWETLREAVMTEMPFQPPFVVKFLIDDFPAGDVNALERATHPYSWHEAFVFEDIFHAAFALEWVKICPRYFKERGRLVSPEVTEGERYLCGILNKYSIPFEKDEKLYTVYGWR